MATEGELYWRSVGNNPLAPSKTDRDVLRCSTCEELYRVSNPTQVQTNGSALGHRAGCWLLLKWSEGVDAGVFDPTGTPDPPGGGGGGGGGGGEGSTWDELDTAWDDLDTAWSDL